MNSLARCVEYCVCDRKTAYIYLCTTYIENDSWFVIEIHREITLYLISINASRHCLIINKTSGNKIKVLSWCLNM